MQATNALVEIMLEQQVPIVSLLETQIVSALKSDIKSEEQLPLVLVKTSIMQATDISETKLEKQPSLTPTIQVSLGDALNSQTELGEEARIDRPDNPHERHKLEGQVPIACFLAPYGLISEMKLAEEPRFPYVEETPMCSIMPSSAKPSWRSNLPSYLP